MSALSFVRMARRVVGLSPDAAFPNLETLLEKQTEEASYDYRILSYVAPGVVGSFGLAGVIGELNAGHLQFLLALPVVAGVALASFLGLSRLDRAIPRPRKQIRKLSEEIWGRYQSVYSVTGVEPAISPLVGALLDDAAAIYLRHISDSKNKRIELGESYGRAVDALEEAMARLLTLAEPKTITAQEMEYIAGWAQPLLHEMQEMDRVLDRHSMMANSSDPLQGLREARLEIQGIESALRELEQNQ